MAAAQQEAKLARDKAGALDSTLQRSHEKIAAQQEQLVQLQAEVERLQQQVQSFQVAIMLIACTMQVYGHASAGYSCMSSAALCWVQLAMECEHD